MSKILPRPWGTPAPRRVAHPAKPARTAARGQSCAIMLPHRLGHDESTVVLCHLPGFEGGGMGTKPSDAEAVFGCTVCHDIIDGRRKWKRPSGLNMEKHLLRALIHTQRILRQLGAIIVKGET